MAKIYKDPCSFANTEFYKLDHLELDWFVDFETKTLKGISKLLFEINHIFNDSNRTIVKNKLYLKCLQLFLKSENFI